MEVMTYDLWLCGFFTCLVLAIPYFYKWLREADKDLQIGDLILILFYSSIVSSVWFVIVIISIIFLFIKVILWIWKKSENSLKPILEKKIKII